MREKRQRVADSEARRGAVEERKDVNSWGLLRCWVMSEVGAMLQGESSYYNTKTLYSCCLVVYFYLI